MKLRRNKINVYILYLYTYVPSLSQYTTWIYVCELLHFENHAVLRKETQNKKSKKKKNIYDNNRMLQHK